MAEPSAKRFRQANGNEEDNEEEVAANQEALATTPTTTANEHAAFAAFAFGAFADEVQDGGSALDGEADVDSPAAGGLPHPPLPAAGTGETFTIRVKYGGSVISITHLTKLSSVGSLKAELQSRTGLKLKDQKLTKTFPT